MRTLLLIALIFAYSTSVFADSDETTEKQRQIAIKIIGDDDIEIKELMDRIKADAGEHANVQVTIDDKGNMSVNGDVDHHFKMFKMDGMPQGLHFNRWAGHDRQPMSESAAECVLKSLGKVQTEGEARLLREACVTIHAITE